VCDAKPLEVLAPLIEFGSVVDLEPHVVKAGAARVEHLALVAVVLLELDHRTRRWMHQQDGMPCVARGSVDLSQPEDLRPPLEMCEILLNFGMARPLR